MKEDAWGCGVGTLPLFRQGLGVDGPGHEHPSSRLCEATAQSGGGGFHPDTAGGRCAGVGVGLGLQQLPEGGAVRTREAEAPRAWRLPTAALGIQDPFGTSTVLASGRAGPRGHKALKFQGPDMGKPRKPKMIYHPRCTFARWEGFFRAHAQTGQRARKGTQHCDQRPKPRGGVRWRGEDNLKGRIT